VYIGVTNPTADEFEPTPVYTKSSRTSSFALAGTPQREVAVGRVIQLPEVVLNEFSTDRNSELIIRFNKAVPIDFLDDLGDNPDPILTSYSKNLLFVGKEMIQYQNYEIDPDGQTVTFRNLFRGRLGTDEYIRAHQANEIAYIYNTDSFITAAISNETVSSGTFTSVTYDERNPQRYRAQVGSLKEPKLLRKWRLGGVHALLDDDIIWIRITPRNPYVNTVIDDYSVERHDAYTGGNWPTPFVLASEFDLETFDQYYQESGIGEGAGGGTNPYVFCGFANAFGYEELTEGVPYDPDDDGRDPTDDLHVGAVSVDINGNWMGAVQGYKFPMSSRPYTRRFESGLIVA
jgi:hypothetical protein